MSSNNPNTNPKKKEKIEQKFNEIIKTVSKIKKGDSNQYKFFKRNKNKKLLKNNSERLSVRSSLESSLADPLGSPLGSSLESTEKIKEITLLESSNKNKILNQGNTNNSKKLLNTDFKFLFNLLKEKRKNNGEGLFKKMGTLVNGLGSSIGTGVKSLGSSVATGVKSLGSSMGKGYDITKKFIVDKTNPEKNVIINISKIKEIIQLVKNDCIYIDITHLIGDYKPTRNEDGKYFEDDALLNTIIYSIISNNENNKDNKNLIIYFTINKVHCKDIYIYNVNENHEYIHSI